MKTLSLFAVLLFGLFTNSFAQKDLATATIKVWGNCGMCKETIEKNALKAGASTADWNGDSKELKVSYASNKTSTEKIQKKIAQSGYDTQDFVAPDKAYNALHGCCKYDRKSASEKGDKAMSCCSADGKCSMDEKACKEKGCCKDASCCSDKGDKAVNCCGADGKCSKDMAACKGKDCCKGASCCK